MGGGRVLETSTFAVLNFPDLSVIIITFFFSN